MNKKELKVSNEYLRNRYEAGESIYSIAKELNISSFLVRSRLINAGIIIRENKKELNISSEDLRNRYEAGESIYSIAKEMKISSFLVKSRLTETGINFRKNSKLKAYVKDIDQYPTVYTDKDVNIDEDIETYFYK